MSNSRFGYQNLLDPAAVVVANGDGIGPVRSEVAPYLMERAMDGERSTFWQAGAANQDSGFAWEIVFDFGAPVAATMMAALAVDGSGLASCNAGVYSSYPSTKSANNLIRNGRDWGLTFASKSSQYWFFKVVATELHKVGDFYIGPHVDLGIVGNTNFDTTPYRVRNEQPQTDGSFNVNDADRMGHDFEMQFLAKNLTDTAKYEALISKPGTVIHIDERDRTFEVLIRGGRLPTNRAHGRRIISLSMVRQP